MKSFIRLGKITFIIISIHFILLENAYGYLDLGSGSYFFQIIIGIFLGVLVTFKVFWSRVFNFLKRCFLRIKKDERPKS